MGIEKLRPIYLYHIRKELHGEFANYGFDINNKNIDEIVEEQSKIFIDNLNEQNKKIFENNGYIYTPKKYKPYKSYKKGA